MKERLEALRAEALQELQQVADPQQLNDLRVKYLGKKGALTEILRGMGSAERRRAAGHRASGQRRARGDRSGHRREARGVPAGRRRRTGLRRRRSTSRCRATRCRTGAVHPLNKVVQEIEDIFIGMGYTIAEGPEVETDFYNFEALNLPKNHPARDMQDSFYMTDEILMRTHTSPVQVRTMQAMKGEAPVKIICPGKVYRRDDDDATHSFQFNQIEGLVIGPQHPHERSERHAAAIRAGDVRQAGANPSASELLPVHRAERGSGRHLRAMRRARLPDVQAYRLARNSRLRHGASARAGDGRLRPERSTAASPSAWASSGSRC